MEPTIMSDGNGNGGASTPVREVEEYTYRKLIRPSLARAEARPAAGSVDDVGDEIRAARGRNFVTRPEPGNEIGPDSRGNQRGRSESRQTAVMDAQPLTPDRGYSNRGVVHEPARGIDTNGGRRIPVTTGPARPRPDGMASNGGAQRAQPKRASRADFAAKKIPPPEQTHAESFYYQKQMQARTVVVAVMQDGEELEGIIEWYDKNCIKMNRVDEPNVVIYKRNIKYLFKADEAAGE